MRSSTTASRPAETAGPTTFRVARSLFLRSLGLVYVVAFASLAGQVELLFGEQGIWPFERLLESVRAEAGGAAWIRTPTIFLALGAKDAVIVGAAWAGVAIGGLLVLGIVPRVSLVLCYVLYLSFRSLGVLSASDAAVLFLGYQWDALLLEAGVLAILLSPGGLFLDRPGEPGASPPSRVALALLWFLSFRLFFGSAWVKLNSGDPTWALAEPTALQFHFFTQPLPNALAWYANALPDVVLSLAAQWMYVVEGLFPFLLLVCLFEGFSLAPPVRRLLRVLRHLAAFGFLSLLVGIAFTGSYGFFHLLSAALVILLVDDEAFAALLRWVPGLGRWARVRVESSEAAEPRGPRASPMIETARMTVFLVTAVLLGFVAVVVFGAQVDGSAGRARTLRPVFIAAERFGIASRYGLFARMTTERPELFLEGSADGRTWRRYEFRYKPEDATRRPRWAGFHMPRVDWQLWFAALESDRELGARINTPWIRKLLIRILEGAPHVDGLFARNPFPEAPPRYVRILVADSRFTTPEERRESGSWWLREELRVFHPAVGFEGEPEGTVPSREPGAPGR